MIPRRGRPKTDWPRFLRENAADVAAIDLFRVTTATFGHVYGVVVMGLGRRRILHVDAADHRAAAWLRQVITEAFPWDKAPRVLVRDNDGAYGLVFRRRLAAMGVRDRPIMPYSPWQNGYIERLIGSIRRECLDHLLIRDAAQLRRVLKAYAEYYNNDRPHLSLGKDAPNSRAVEAEGRIVSRPVLGGLHRRYGRVKER